MASSLQFDPFAMTFYTTALTASLTRLVSAAITTRLATTFLTTESTFGLAVTASAIEIFALFTLLASLGLFLRRVSRGLILAAWVPAACSGLLATILSLTTLTSTIHLSHQQDRADQTSARGLAQGGLAIGVVALIPQTIYFILVWPRGKRVATTEDPPQQYQPPVQTVSRSSIAVHLASLQPGSTKSLRPIAEPASPPISASSLAPRFLFRNSTQRALKPMTSRTRLIIPSSLASRDSRDSSLLDQPATIPEATRSNDDFGSWDTSAVDDSCDSPFVTKSKFTRLETIPGSRPVSPAYPLDGPFQGPAESKESPLPDSLPQSPELGSETASLRTFSRSRRPRSSTTGTDQSHIHPLFRSESPGPPPLVSAGTVITASVYAGQVVNPEIAPRILYSSNGSRPVSPMPGLWSPASSRSRTGSLKSFRTVPTSPIEPLERPLEGTFRQLARSRTPQPDD